MKAAVTVWEGRISPVLDTARSLVVADIEAGGWTSQHEEIFPDDAPQEKVSRLCALGVEVLVCGAVSRPLAELISSSGIRLVPFVSGGLDEILTALADERLPDPAFSMPGCGCRQGHRFRGRHRMCSSRRPSVRRSL